MTFDNWFRHFFQGVKRICLFVNGLVYNAKFALAQGFTQLEVLKLNFAVKLLPFLTSWIWKILRKCVFFLFFDWNWAFGCCGGKFLDLKRGYFCIFEELRRWLLSVFFPIILFLSSSIVFLGNVLILFLKFVFPFRSKCRIVIFTFLEIIFIILRCIIITSCVGLIILTGTIVCILWVFVVDLFDLVIARIWSGWILAVKNAW